MVGFHVGDQQSTDALDLQICLVLLCVKFPNPFAARQYREFFGDVRGLAQNLDTLSSVVNSASEQLSRQGTYAVARWHPSSLYQIIGDYHNTLRECRELINTNWRYGENSSVLRNLEWNMLVQPSADQLRQRILLHNSKVAQVLKPFEM